ncbi:type II toxin-antitoxin system RelE/ParE family toxin [Pseudogracilibacillus sp. SO30301A]|uniref:type II toxin-antitoxin system RelE/ParE family toxin n=1 Tax=Pseudogracilibacillus sp. SO30301A TaxID=3098291 RepID=UPI00300E0D93
MSDFQIHLLPGARKYLKSLKKNKHLRNKFQIVIDELRKNPFLGEEKKGDLAGVFTIDFTYNKTVYELAYFIVQKQDGQYIFVILAGTRDKLL